MKIGIYSSIYVGDVYDHTIDYIAADKGVVHLLDLGIKPIFVIGDFDSLDNKDILKQFDIKAYSPIKDDTDTALAIKEAIERGYDEIDLYGVTGKRLDHFMAVLCLLKRYKHIKITIYDQDNKIYLLHKGIHTITKDNYKYFSLFSYQPTYVTLKNCHYPLDNYLLNSDDALCVSNQMDNELYIDIDQDVLFIQSR